MGWPIISKNFHFLGGHTTTVHPSPAAAEVLDFQVKVC